MEYFTPFITQVSFRSSETIKSFETFIHTFWLCFQSSVSVTEIINSYKVRFCHGRFQLTLPHWPSGKSTNPALFFKSCRPKWRLDIKYGVKIVSALPFIFMIKTLSSSRLLTISSLVIINITHKILLSMAVYLLPPFNESLLMHQYMADPNLIPTATGISGFCRTFWLAHPYQCPHKTSEHLIHIAYNMPSSGVPICKSLRTKRSPIRHQNSGFWHVFSRSFWSLCHSKISCFWT